MVKLVDSTLWIPLIGKLFIAFGGIERTSHSCIREWAGDGIHKHFAKLSLSLRLNLAADLAESQNVSESTQDAFRKALKEVRTLSQYRNLVAHNPLCLVFLQRDLDTTMLEAIASNVNDKHLTLKELTEIVALAEACDEDFLSAFVAFRVEGMDFESLKHFPGLS